ncbi:MAG: isoleucine--tRNA ligase [Campylobacteraceae bacterium 4484_166]|nr:MAG: isoleucine--tRNA ligase [Campylobacteraceae bacterium 4484_166]
MTNYKDTMLLPKTNFPMRGNLPQNEPIKYKKWYSDNIYDKMKQNRKNRPIWTFHDGPPYANGNIHIGHALNKILKDIVVKYHYFDGYDVRFTPGWDCHGLPIEQKVEEKVGGQKKKEMPKVKFRQLCRNHATKYIDIQKDEFKQLGIIANWDKPYLTMNFKFEANIYRELIAIAKHGLLCQRSKPVFWSWAAKTALAEAEVEYKDKISPSVYVAFKLKDSDKSLIIWTTTPWTLVANTGIALNGDEEYVSTTDNYIVAKQLHQYCIDQDILKGDIVNTIDPKTLERKVATNPLNGRDSTIVLASHVEMTAGTGCVHTAPGHGEDDYKVALKYNLEVLMPVADNGCYDESLIKDKLLFNPEELVGVNVFKANEKILELLGESLLKRVDITHSYPFCWRTHKPVIFRATKQWFIQLDAKYGKENKTLRQNAIDTIDDIKFYPKNGKKRLRSMIENRPDWCISRQRDWGVPIAFFRQKSTDKIIYDEKVLNYIAMIFDKFGCDAWYDMSIKELLYPGCNIDADDLEKTTDILDVWFDSGSTQNAVLRSGDYDGEKFPADMYLEGSDQHRGWFQSSLLTSLSSCEKPPYKTVLTHGFTVDAKGEKMSKSKGNVVSPDKVIKQYGADILRLWVAMSDYQNDLKISDEILKQMAEQYRKIRNTMRFLLSNIDDLEEFADINTLQQTDRWILQKAKQTLKEIDDDFKNYDYSKGLNQLNNFLVADLSNVYLDICKDRLYCNKKDDPNRRASQTAMAMITKALLRTLAPILTYTMDEIISYAPKVVTNDAKNIFDFEEYTIDDINCDFDYKFLLKIKEGFNEAVENLKKDKIIKSTLELVVCDIDGKLDILNSTEAEDWLVVSKIIHHKEDQVLTTFEVDTIEFEVYKTSKQKCPRCWKYRAKTEDSLCKRCQDVV